jgi:polyribonucleotide nucleotidyltransferase
VVVTLLSCDGAVDPLVLAINAASAAALVAGLPLAGPAA